MIELTAKDIELCIGWAKSVCGSGVMRRANYAGQVLSDFDRYFYGYCGERAFSIWLSQSGIPHRHIVNVSGRSQSSEFLVGGKRVEVKTSGHPRAQYFAFPAAQKIDAAFAVGVHLVGSKTADVKGGIVGDDANELPVKDFSRGVPSKARLYRDLPLNELQLLATMFRLSLHG